MSRKDRPFRTMTPTERWVFQTHERYRLFRVIATLLGIALIVFLAVPLPVLWGVGQETVITLTYKAIIEGKLADKIQKGLVLALGVLAAWQRWSYMRRFKHLGKRTEQLERKIDSKRSSSNPQSDL